jgi:putative SOS response-associated peptidase YedK
MCGRYTLKTPVEHLSEMFQFPEVIPIKPRYNIAPSQDMAVVRTLTGRRFGLEFVHIRDEELTRLRTLLVELTRTRSGTGVREAGQGGWIGSNSSVHYT